ncbi:hypothetical protein FKZ61_012410 [Litorilinea aerophila]|uniref:Tetratricopeptide repeat protein n=1 Tax=Litorilinea aerophila TaxID=1204385 RepID=A0A540VF48_9CHLR|nr:hypothetical protein [Litorilinea aerophila]MCC9076907.1 hypothetical protein [Litorilinea aerophila]
MDNSTNGPKNGHAAQTVEIPLTSWYAAMKRALQQDAPEEGARLAQVVLQHLPRHLWTYRWLLRLTWLLRRWEEGEEWGRRLLQADPGHALAWRALARAAEQRGQRARAQAMWQRAFEMAPFEPEIRAGLARTSLEAPHALAFNPACLATLYRLGGRWAEAAALYRALVRAEPRRIDFQVCLMVALWQLQAREEAYHLARHLVQSQPHLLMGWVVLEAVGDENDWALAQHPIQSMDPDGEFVRRVYRVPRPQETFHLRVTEEEARLLDAGERA